MKGKYYTAIIITSAVFLLVSNYSFSSSASKLPESAPPRYSQEGNETRATLKQVTVKEYVVRRGDSLIKIGNMFGTTPEAIQSVNGLAGTKILIGQKLCVPIVPKPHTTVLVTEVAGADPDADIDPRRIQLVQAGFELLGVRYRWSGRSVKYGFDCSGLVKTLFAKFDIELPHSSREQYRHGERVDRDKLQMGDLVFFAGGGKIPDHVGIYLGNDKFLHAARKARRVIISDLKKHYYSNRYLGARRLMNPDWD